ncbi:hypothetical protein C9374_011545 [Naegleria lovaniensis]|uniref:AAA+ ATPase domain-containing protein n=1 Tax=Naegleria lovaniensis TaxID=51637 RepID=A0AA88H0W3_NAELO|nr:uncharacterized protein C9374_011545 [Naegleria lovaniensis]KAG2392820.1 hypothetical protein C9374_011545 [Naegleria lovaniensis]
MSNVYYEGLLSEVLVELRDLLVVGENKLANKANLPKNILEQQALFNQHYQSLYVKYVNLYNKMEMCYDQMLQPQKREDLKVILENVIGRILEIKSIIIKLMGEFPEFDEILIDLKLDPNELEIRIPRFLHEDNEKEIRRREILLDVLRKRPSPNGDFLARTDPSASQNTQKNNTLTINQAILIIQTNERGRQGRNIARIKLEQKLGEERKKTKKDEDMDSIMDEAAIKIQKVFRGFYWRKRIDREKREEAKFLGMSLEGAKKQQQKKEVQKEEPAAQEDTPVKIKEMDHLGRAKRKIKQAENKRDLEEQRIKMRSAILEEEGPQMIEDMHDALMEQILLYRQEGDGGIPRFPSESDGGSKAFMQNIIKATEEQKKLLAEQKKEALAPPSKNKKGGSAPASSTKKPPAKGGKDQPQAEATPTMKDESKFIPTISVLLKQLVEKWRDRVSSLDFDQKFDKSLLRKELMEGDKGIEEEIRKKVDNQIREELDNLRLQLESENPPKKPAKPEKPPAKPKEEVKMPSSEAFFSDLASMGIITKVPPLTLDSFLGEPRLIGSILEWEEPSLAQIRNVCQEIILYMSTPTVHKEAPPLRSILFYGHKGTGKTHLAHAISHELGAVFFDLSPAVTQNICTEQSEATTMIGKLFRVAKDMQPAVIYIDDFDTIIKGKGKGKTKANMKRLRKPLLTQMKAMTPDDRILIIANMNEPWDADTALFGDFFDRMVYTTLPDYSSCRVLWRTLLEKAISRPLSEEFDLHTLAHISTNYTVASIKLIIESVINERRIAKLDTKPLQVDEFVVPLSKIDPIYQQDDLKMKQFTQKLPQKYRKKTKEEKDKERQDLEAKMAEEKNKNKKKK